MFHGFEHDSEPARQINLWTICLASIAIVLLNTPFNATWMIILVVFLALRSLVGVKLAAKRDLLFLMEVGIAFSTLWLLSGTGYLLVFVIFWTIYAAMAVNTQFQMLTIWLGIGLTYLIHIPIKFETGANEISRLICLGLTAGLLYYLWSFRKRTNNELIQTHEEISAVKEEAAALQTMQDEKFKEMLAAKVSLEERYAELYTLQIINDVANSELSIDILGEKVVDILTGLTGSTACSVILLNQDEPPSILATSITSEAQREELTHSEAEQIFRQTLAGTETVCNTQAEEIPFLQRRGTRSCVVIPLRLKTGSSGIIFAEHSVKNAFNSETRKILMTAADRLAIAIDNARLYDRMERMAVTDALTGVYNRLYLHQYLYRFFSDEQTKSIALAILDADHFKKVNDTYGHLTGDTTLKQLAAQAKSILPPGGMVARYGGEEFVVIVPEFTCEQMNELAEKLRIKVQEMQIKAENGSIFHVTISLGVSTVPDFANNAEELMQSADEALYRAKESGRNRVCLAIKE
jgi:diguanylate cyclase (GGDEF)-like protein